MEREPIERDFDRLQLASEDMRRLGYQVVDMIVDHLERLPNEPVNECSDRSELEPLLREPPPSQPVDATEVLRRLERDVLGKTSRHDHPRFFAFVPSPGNFISTVADALISGYNIFAGTWVGASGPAELELVTIDWLRETCGLPSEGGGLFVASGSLANLTCLSAAAHSRAGHDLRLATMYMSDQTHSSLERAAFTIGIPRENVRILEADHDQRLALGALAESVRADRAQGKQPFCVVANAGTTNTGAVDDLPAIADFCKSESLWFHVDGAYGASAALTPRGKRVLRGLERADSISLDPHKWLFQPYEIGAVLVRDVNNLRSTFAIHADYLQDVQGGPLDEVNFADYGIQLTRNFRALKLWMSIQVFGLDAFRNAIDRGIDLAEHAEAVLRASSRWEVVTGAELGIVTFRLREPKAADVERDRTTRRLALQLRNDGFALLSSTSLRGQDVLRFCTINPRTSERDIEETILRLERLLDGPEPTSGVPVESEVDIPELQG